MPNKVPYNLITNITLDVVFHYLSYKERCGFSIADMDVGAAVLWDAMLEAADGPVRFNKYERSVIVDHGSDLEIWVRWFSPRTASSVKTQWNSVVYHTRYHWNSLPETTYALEGYLFRNRCRVLCLLNRLGLLPEFDVTKLDEIDTERYYYVKTSHEKQE